MGRFMGRSEVLSGVLSGSLSGALGDENDLAACLAGILELKRFSCRPKREYVPDVGAQLSGVQQTRKSADAITVVTNQ